MEIVKKNTDVTDVSARDINEDVVDTDPKSYSRIGWLIVLLGFGGFMLWALLAPLDKGVPFSGTVVAESNRQAVQYQAGGMIEAILVKDGDVVKAGQTLVRMNKVNVQAANDMTRAQFMAARATEARLLAERDGKATIAFPTELTSEKADPKVAELMSLQTQLLGSRRSSLQSELGAIDETIAGLKSQVEATKESLENKKAQLGFLKEQLVGMRDLSKDGYVARSRLLELERTYAQVNGSISEDIGQISRAQRQIAEYTLRKSQRGQDYQKEVRTQLNDIRSEGEVQESRLRAQQFELHNTDLKAPAAGTVVGLAVFTPGGVVPPGFRLMDIVPAGEPLVVEGRLAVNLIDKVHVGLPVELMFSAFNANSTPHIPGEVMHVSADRSVDEHNGMPFYLVRVKVTPEGHELVAKNKLAIQSGMPVELFVKTGERTMMNYLFRPLWDRVKVALTEE